VLRFQSWVLLHGVILEVSLGNVLVEMNRYLAEQMRLHAYLRFGTRSSLDPHCLVKSLTDSAIYISHYPIAQLLHGMAFLFPCQLPELFSHRYGKKMPNSTENSLTLRQAIEKSMRMRQGFRC
jgi:hypothetical protein